MNNTGFGKNMENVRKDRDVELFRVQKSNYLVSEPNYHTKKFFKENKIKRRCFWINLSN